MSGVLPLIVMKMRCYYTGLQLHSNESLSRRLKGRGWMAGTLPALDNGIRWGLESCSEDKRAEIVIYARSLERALAASSLILDAYAVLNGALIEKLENILVPADKVEREELRKESPLNRQSLWNSSGLLLCCLIAQRASLKNKFVYALALCRQSIALHSNHAMDLNPGMFPYQHRSLCAGDQVRFAYAIVTAYAVLERLGLDLKDKCFENGRWIEAKRQDLEKRLVRAGLNLSEPVSWYLRGGKSKLEIKRPPVVHRKSSWCRGKVRDCELSLVDAIGDLRWLRSGVAAHSVSALVSRLSVHDVANAQTVAKRAILASLGFDEETVNRLYHEFKDGTMIQPRRKIHGHRS